MKTFEVAIDGHVVKTFEGANDEEACHWAGRERSNSGQTIVTYEKDSSRHARYFANGVTKSPPSAAAKAEAKADDVKRVEVTVDAKVPSAELSALISVMTMFFEGVNRRIDGFFAELDERAARERKATKDAAKAEPTKVDQPESKPKPEEKK